MKLFRARVLCPVLLCACLTLRAAESPEGLVVEPQGAGEFDFNPQTGVATAAQGVIVRYGSAVLTANKVTVNQQTGEVLAEGNVRIEHDGQTWIGSRIAYNFKTRALSTGHFRTGQLPFFVEGRDLSTVLTNRMHHATNAAVTTDDYAAPLYTIRAKKITVIPGKCIKARGATVWLGKVPVFYLPYTYRSLEHHPNFWVVTPGYRSLFGPYLLNSYHVNWSPEFSTALNLDYRGRRGPGLGPDLEWHSPTLGEGTLRYYYVQDDEPFVNRFGQPLPENRQRLWFSHQATLRSNLTVKAVARWQSDEYVVRDFFESEYRDNVQPSSFLEVNQDWSNWNLNLYAQPQVNEFQQTLERLPDVKLTGLRQEIGQSPFYYESDSSLGYYRQHWLDTNAARVLSRFAYEALRADTYHQVVVPFTFFGWLNVTPRAGGRLTYYGEASGPLATTREQGRAVFNTGVEVSFKASRLWRNVHNSLLDLNGLRHIIEPSVNYAFVPRPHPLPAALPQFDSELAGYRLLPIDFPDYNAIDSMDSQNAVRFGLGNRLQTKRGGELDELLRWAVYADWRLKPNATQRTFSDAYSDLEFKPRTWLTVSSETRYDINERRLREAYHVATVHPPSAVWSWSAGHRYRETTAALGPGNNTLLSSLTVRLNENWAVRATHHFEARDGHLEEQSYTIYRDLRSWTAALIVRWRDHRGFGRDDYTIAVTFSLKAFPRFRLGEETDRPSRLLGG